MKDCVNCCDCGEALKVRVVVQRLVTVKRKDSSGIESQSNEWQEDVMCGDCLAKSETEPYVKPKTISKEGPMENPVLHGKK